MNGLFVIGVFSVVALLAILIAIFTSSKKIRLIALVILLISGAFVIWIVIWFVSLAYPTRLV